jgi:hypothetical protein
MKYRVQVNTYGDPEDSWTGNNITHASSAQAKIAAEDLAGRWTAVKFWRVIDQNDKVVASNIDPEICS